MHHHSQFHSACPLSNCYVHLEGLDHLHPCQRVVNEAGAFATSDIVGVIGYLNVSIYIASACSP